MHKRLRNQRGAALIETAITIPLVLLVSVAIFEFGRAYQTWQVLTNAAREGARIAVLEGPTDAQVTTTVRDYLTAGHVVAHGRGHLSVGGRKARARAEQPRDGRFWRCLAKARVGPSFSSLTTRNWRWSC